MNKPHLRYKDQTPKERHWTMHLLAGVKFLKGILLLLVAVKLLTLIDRDLNLWFADFIARHRIDPDNKIVHTVIEKIAGVNKNQLIFFSVGSFLYSALQLTEGIGLWLEKRWAEFLTVIATSLMIPVEVYEIFVKFTWIRIGALVVNLFVVWYLATRLKDEKKELI
ncbi:MAG: DUF2127 domain-containing protein, partial [Acidobacteria bacterium]|nr:DUF2127 domain-containing protein [Acidobacteriota bacterium]